MGPYCKFCCQRCFVYLPADTPTEIVKAYGTSTIVATCKAGQQFEKDSTGYCYDDILAAIAANERAQIDRNLQTSREVAAHCFDPPEFDGPEAA